MTAVAAHRVSDSFGGLLLGLAPIFAWSGRRTHKPAGGRAAKGKLAFGRQEAR